MITRRKLSYLSNQIELLSFIYKWVIYNQERGRIWFVFNFDFDQQNSIRNIPNSSNTFSTSTQMKWNELPWTVLFWSREFKYIHIKALDLATHN